MVDVVVVVAGVVLVDVVDVTVFVGCVVVVVLSLIFWRVLVSWLLSLVFMWRLSLLLQLLLLCLFLLVFMLVLLSSLFEGMRAGHCWFEGWTLLV